MIKISILTGLAWAAIIGLAWRLADQRILLCRGDDGYGNLVAATPACIIQATASRDMLLVGGLIVALIASVASLLMARYYRRGLRHAARYDHVSRPEPDALPPRGKVRDAA